MEQNRSTADDRAGGVAGTMSLNMDCQEPPREQPASADQTRPDASALGPDERACLREQMLSQLPIAEEGRQAPGWAVVQTHASDLTDEVVDRFAVCVTRWDRCARRIDAQEASAIENNKHATDDVWSIGDGLWATDEGDYDLACAMDPGFDVRTGQRCGDAIFSILMKTDTLPYLRGISSDLDRCVQSLLGGGGAPLNLDYRQMLNDVLGRDSVLPVLLGISEEVDLLVKERLATPRSEGL